MYAVNKKNKLDVIICDKVPKGYEEILEESYREIVGDEAEISDSGTKNFTYLGYGKAAEQTFAIDAKDGSAMFASGAVKITELTMTWTSGNSYPATGRPIFNGSTGATIDDLKGYGKLASANTWTNTNLFAGITNGAIGALKAITNFGGFVNYGNLSLSTNGAQVPNASISVAGNGDSNGYGINLQTPNGIYAPKGFSQLGSLQMVQSAQANLGIIYPKIPNCINAYSMGFGWDGSRVRYLVDNNPAAAGALANLNDIPTSAANSYSLGINNVTYTCTVAGGALLYGSRGISNGNQFNMYVGSNLVTRLAASGTNGSFQASVSAAVYSGATFHVDSDISANYLILSAQRFSNPAYWVLDNSGRVFAYLEEQEYLYTDHIKRGDGIDCGRAPEEFEEWVNGKWVINKEQEAKSKTKAMVFEAKSLLSRTDRFELPLYKNIITEAERTTFNAWRAKLLEVAMEIIKVMPEAPEFVKKLLEL